MSHPIPAGLLTVIGLQAEAHERATATPRTAGRPLRASWFSSGLMVGGLFTMLGAAFPWLRLYGGLERFSNQIELFSRLAFVCGMVGVMGGAYAMRARPAWLAWSAAGGGIVLLGLTTWLYGALSVPGGGELSVVLVFQTGPGLFIVTGAAWVLFLTGVSRAIRHPDSRVRRQRVNRYAAAGPLQLNIRFHEGGSSS